MTPDEATDDASHCTTLGPPPVSFLGGRPQRVAHRVVIDQLPFTREAHEVLRLQVRVHQALLVQRHDALQQPQRDGSRAEVVAAARRLGGGLFRVLAGSLAQVLRQVHVLHRASRVCRLHHQLVLTAVLVEQGAMHLRGDVRAHQAHHFGLARRQLRRLTALEHDGHVPL